jgi:hypothetical protein
MRAFFRLRLRLAAAPLLVSTLAFGQAEQSVAAQQPTASQPSQQPTTPPPAKPRPNARPSVADAARASKQLQTSAPAAKVYRNKDLKDPADAGSPATARPSVAVNSTAQPALTQTASLPASHPAVQTADEEIQRDRAFEAQAMVFKSEILMEKGKIAGIQTHMAGLKDQFAAWSAEYSQDDEAPLCWTSSYTSPYYKDWCDTGRNLKAQYDASQRQLDQEKARLDQMQENIRRHGYGNAIYDPD